MAKKIKHYKDVDNNPSFPSIESSIIKKWHQYKIFDRSLKGEEEFIFYDGPPFANGLPHYGHLLTGYIKDAVARYQTMIGKKVRRVFGWDCHGLPAEMEAEKTLQVSGRKAIIDYGVDKFNQQCRELVMKYTKEWEYYVTRQARWVDFENNYKTMDINFMESVIWAFKELYNKGLIYESVRIMPYSWKCQTPVSDFETRIDNSFREKVSKSVTAAIELQDNPFNLNLPTYLLIWTTTPWTLPSNLAVAVNDQLDYALIIHQDRYYIIAATLAHHFKKEIGSEVIMMIKGEDLVGLKYKPLFPYFQDHMNAFVILSGSFVTDDNGTGAVHIAPGFGEDDYHLCLKHHIYYVCPIDDSGHFTAPINEYIGQHVFDTNDDIIRRLKEQGQWIKTEQYIHNYPHCWRTDTPLIYRAMPSWYLKVTNIKERIIENNQQIHWIPEHIKNGLFGKWLENARDWSISRQRFWGCPIPVWLSDDPAYPNIEVYGSIAELEEAFGIKVTTLHRPFIDGLTRPNPKDPTGKSKMRRVPDILDCWFESGSMPFAQVHYPFENREWFETHASADFIVEYMAQTRGWFYTLLVISTALFDRPPFYNCICHGVILGDGGQKLSKRLQNYADPNLVFNQFGADALRWYLISSAVMRGQEIIIDKNAQKIQEIVRLVIKPIWNAYNFFIMYANADGIQAQHDTTFSCILDHYILIKCSKTIAIIKQAMDNYDIQAATKASEIFFEILNNWYIRRSRERFWRHEIDRNKIAAYNTLFTVLDTMCRAIAPLMPLITEEIYMGIHPELEEHDSIHLQSFPNLEIAHNKSDAIIADMERVRAACNTALSIRNEVGIRIRQPLKSVTFIGISSNHEFNNEMQQLILDEINVKEWKNLPTNLIEKYASYTLRLIFSEIGKRIPNAVKDIITASKKGQWHKKGDTIKIADEEILPHEFELYLEIKPEFKNSAASLPSHDGLVLLDIELTPDLVREGIARDIVRAIQQYRKNINLDITDRISLYIESTDIAVREAITEWAEYICEQTFAQFTDKHVDEIFHPEEMNVQISICKS